MYVLKMSTDYAIRSLLYLSKTRGYATSSEIAEAMSIPRSYASQVLNKLKNAGMIQAKLGNAGGFALACDPKDVSMIDIIKLMNDSLCLNRCLERDRFCSRNATGNCSVHDLYKSIQDGVDSYLDQITLAEILERQERIQAQVEI